uniref:Katanin p60 ATPase-containing subunit A-like 2 isoform X2 n=1 Tax=Rhizophora mucronata TaxID=61149 RepID=A0A2P2L313_RHIMU
MSPLSLAGLFSLGERRFRNRKTAKPLLINQCPAGTLLRPQYPMEMVTSRMPLIWPFTSSTGTRVGSQRTRMELCQMNSINSRRGLCFLPLILLKHVL